MVWRSNINSSMADFIVFYDDGSQLVGNALSLDQIKPYGVICIVQERADGRNHILSQKDFYAFTGNHWIVLDAFGLADHVIHKLKGLQKVIAGRTVDNQTYYDIMERAKKHV